MKFMISAFLFALLVAIFAIQNSLPVYVTFFIWSFQISLVLVIIGAAAFGALTVLSLASLIQYRLKLTIKQSIQHQGELEAENNILHERLEKEFAKMK
jgi:uncharacterized integral membrane protein